MIIYPNRRYYFQYVPPEVEGFGPGKQMRKNRVGRFSWEGSVYYYWWAFLRRNADFKKTAWFSGKGPCAKLFADFGNVLDSEFPEWWMQRGRELFCEPVGSAAKIVTAAELGEPESDYRMVVSVERYGDIDRTLAELRRLLQEGSESRQSRVKVSRALYQAMHGFTVKSLHEHLLVHENDESGLCQEPDEIVNKYGLSVGYPKHHSNWKSAAKAAIRRYREENERMIEYAGRGVFPVITAEDETRVGAFLEEREQHAQERRKEIKSGLYCEPFGS